jgi:hypothetical protein
MFFSLFPKNQNSYYHPYNQIIDSHANLWQQPQHPHFTLHGPEHATAIIDKISKWLNHVPKSHLNLLDTFLLKAAIYLHDIGMQCPPGPILYEVTGINDEVNVPFPLPQLELIRSKHHILSRKMVEDILENPRRCCWNHVRTTGIEGEIMAIALLCEGHAVPNLGDVPKEITNTYTINLPQETNLSRLLYLLRLGDAMNAEATRINNRYVQFNWHGLSPKDKFHIWKHWFVSNINVTGAGVITFNYTVPHEYENLIPDIETCAEAPLQNGLREMGPQLHQWDVYTPIVDRTIHITDGNTHSKCPLGKDGWTVFTDEARKIRECRERQSLNSQGTIEAYAPILPDNQASTLVIDDEKHVFVPLKCSSIPEENPQDLISTCKDILSKQKVPLVLGSYGMGKSYFSRKFLYDMINDRMQRDLDKLAVIIPLRDLHYAQTGKADILEAVLYVLDADKMHPFDRENFRKRWHEGRLLLLLDGIDEIPFVYQDNAADKCLEHLIDLVPNDVVVTCRIGLLSDSSLKNSRIVPLYLQRWDFSDFETYVELCRGFIDRPDDIIQKVKSQESLKDMVTRPLYARMIVEVGRDISHLDDAITDEYMLVEHFVHTAFTRKKHLSVYKGKIDAKIECMMAIAGHLLRTGLSHGSIDELRDVANRQLGHAAQQISKFFEAEVSVYSLMQPIGEGCVTFSHETIRDYFTVRYIGRIWELVRQETVAEYLDVQPLSSCAIRFLVQQFRDHQEELREFALKLQNNSQYRSIKQTNGKAILSELGEKI